MKSIGYYHAGRIIMFAVMFATVLALIVSRIDLSFIVARDPRLADLVSYSRILSVPFLLSGILAVIDRWLWRTRLFSWLVRVPDLGGRYTGESTSSFIGTDGRAIKKLCTLEIQQTASAVSVALYLKEKATGRESVSKSITADILVEKQGSVRLVYVYLNEQGTLAPGSPQDHPGAALLRYTPSPKSFCGEYFNRRQNVGELRVSFEQHNLRHVI